MGLFEGLGTNMPAMTEKEFTRMYDMYYTRGNCGLSHSLLNLGVGVYFLVMWGKCIKAQRVYYFVLFLFHSVQNRWLARKMGDVQTDGTRYGYKRAFAFAYAHSVFDSKSNAGAFWKMCTLGTSRFPYSTSAGAMTGGEASV